jgi:hypothetical protein
MPSPRRFFLPEHKTEAAELIPSIGKRIGQVARKLRAGNLMHPAGTLPAHTPRLPLDDPGARSLTAWDQAGTRACPPARGRPMLPYATPPSPPSPTV